MKMFSKKKDGEAVDGPPRRRPPREGGDPRRRGPPRGKRRPPGRGPPGKRPPGERRRPPGERERKPKKDYEFDRFEIEVGTPKVTGMEKDTEEKKEEKKVKEVIKGYPDEIRITMDPKAEARFANLEKDVAKLDNNVSLAAETMVSIESDLQEIKEGYSRVDVIIKELEETRDSYAKVDKTMRELAALYDLISAQINPFIDMGGHVGASNGLRWDGIEDNVELIRQRVGDETGFPPEEDTEPFGKEKGADWKKEESIPPSRTQFYYESNVLKWIKFLLSKIRQEDIPNLLKYYREIGWINEDVEITTMNFLTGAKSEPNLDLMEGDIYISEDGTVIGQTDGWKLSVEDHSRSLECIEEILKYCSPKV